jgi:hypothetical protein
VESWVEHDDVVADRNSGLRFADVEGAAVAGEDKSFIG